MLVLQNISYIHPDKESLFRNINFTINLYDKIALTGNNGTGKSTLLRIIAGQLQPSKGQVHATFRSWFVPQLFGQYDHLTIAQALGIDQKLHALQAILEGHTTSENFHRLNDDWTIEERCHHALQYWQLEGLSLTQKLANLSGGQKTKLFLAGIAIHQPELVLLDEPSNHLDTSARQKLNEFIETASCAMIIVSHDRRLLNSMNTICELHKEGITVYGGNYDFYAVQKSLAGEALEQDIQSSEKALRKAKQKERESMERQQKRDSRGKKKQEKAGVAKIMINTLRNKAENSTAKTKAVHNEKINGLAEQLQDLRDALPDLAKMKFGFYHSQLHKGKIMVTAKDINYSYRNHPLWPHGQTFQINSGDRIVLKGANGSGKTTLIRLMVGILEPQVGTISRAAFRSVYVDQDYSLLDNSLSIYEQAVRFNTSTLQDHELKIRLTRFLFTSAHWNKPVRALSGGERMRLMLCCLTLAAQAPDLLILDEPTNNIDIQNTEILTAAINEYNGTLLVVSHDEVFLEQAAITQTIQL